MIKNGCGGGGIVKGLGQKNMKTSWTEYILSFTSSQSVSQKSLSATTPIVVVFSARGSVFRFRCSFVYYHYDYYYHHSDYDYDYDFTFLALLERLQLVNLAEAPGHDFRPRPLSRGIRACLIIKKIWYETNFLPQTQECQSISLMGRASPGKQKAFSRLGHRAVGRVQNNVSSEWKYDTNND